MQNSNLYNNQYNEDLKKLMIKTMNFFKSSLYWLLYRLGFDTVLLGVARRHDRPHGLWHRPPGGRHHVPSRANGWRRGVAVGWMGAAGGGWVVGRGDEMRRCVGIGSDWVGLDRIVSARIGPDRIRSEWRLLAHRPCCSFVFFCVYSLSFGQQIK